MHSLIDSLMHMCLQPTFLELWLCASYGLSGGDTKMMKPKRSRSHDLYPKAACAVKEDNFLKSPPS